MEKNQSIIFFKKQNILLRKKIRDYDLKIANKSADTCPYQNTSLNDVNFLVVGPHSAGKTTLIKYDIHYSRLLHYALNGNHNLITNIVQDANIAYKQHQIKNNQRNKIKGVTALDKSD